MMILKNKDYRLNTSFEFESCFFVMPDYVQDISFNGLPRLFTGGFVP